VLSARSFLVRGLLAGLIAGLAAFGVAFVVGEPSINAAIALEEAGSAAEHTHDEAVPHSHGAETGETTEKAVVSRDLQATAGLLTATVIAGTTLGGLLGVLSALALGRLGGLGPRGSTLAVTAITFVALYVVPFAIYPPNPPAVGSPDTIGWRTALYFITMAISVIAAVAAVLGGRRLAQRWSGWHATLAALAGFGVVVVIATALLPNYNEVPDGFPAALLYEFRSASFLISFILWGALGVVLAELAGRLTSAARPASARVADPAR
jgi:Probable cobalt transporter subunit (CbtA)